MKPTSAMKLTPAPIVLALCVGASAAGAQPAARAISDICPNFNEVMAHATVPVEILKRGITSGEVTVTFTLTADNRATDIAAVGATHPLFEQWGLGVVKQLQCDSGGQEQRLSIPFSYRTEPGSSYTATADDIAADRLGDVVPRIAELKVTPEAFNVKVGDGVNIDALKVLAYDRDGKLLGRLRQFDRNAQPKDVLKMRGAGVVQALAVGEGYLELFAPLSIWERSGRGKQRPAVRIRISVSP